MACCACLRNQTDQDFHWIIIVDKHLPRFWQERVLDVAGSRHRTEIVRYESEQQTQGLCWLRRWIDPKAEMVTTTILDDDDLVNPDFVANIKELSRRESGRNDFFLSGCRHAVQWDMIPNGRAEFGYIKPWTRTRGGQRFPVSAGFSLTCKSEIDCSVLSFSHSMARGYFGGHGNSALPPSLDKRLQAELQLNESDWLDWKAVPRFHWLQNHDRPQAVILNHFGNIQVSRLFEDTETRSPVRDLDAIPFQFGVDPQLARDCIRDGRPTLRNFAHTVSASINLARTRATGNWLRRCRYAARYTHINAKGFLRSWRG